MYRLALLLAASFLAGCSSSSSETAVVTDAGTDAATPSDAGADAAITDDAAAAEVRGGRYCEVLVVTLVPPNLQVRVFTTYGLNECPADAWSAVDANAIKASFGASAVVLNGPRYWTMDSLRGSSLLDPTVQTFGTLPMRQAGALVLPAASASTMQSPYTQQTIQRQSVFTWRAGRPVYELVAPDAHVYTMQSFSVQKVTTQTEATLPNLGGSLTLPAGWSFRTRTLTQDLVATATGGEAIVVQDDAGNTYSMTQ
jgi:hypothetical protein